MTEKEYEVIIKQGYGEHLITDSNGNVIATSCAHYFDDMGECIFCGEIKYKSPLWYKYFE